MANENSEIIYSVSRRLEVAKKHLAEKVSTKKISRRKLNTIEKFLEHCRSEGLTKARCLRYVYDLSHIAEWLETNFEKATKDDIKELVRKIEESKYSSHTKYGMRVCIKKFYKWLKGNGEFFPEEVRWMKNNHKDDKIKMPEDMLNEKEILSLIQAAKDPKYRAFISVLAETGCRVGELLTCKIKHYTKGSDNRTAHIFLNGKTGFRKVMMISSVPYMDRWINNHPFNSDPDSFLWIKNSGELITYARIRDMLKALGKRAKIKKKVNPHNFRHSRATYLAGRITEAQLKDYLGWKQSSKMAGVYVHLSGRDTDSAIMKINGLETKEEQERESTLIPKACSRCEKTNEASGKFCIDCGTVLDKEEMERMINEDMERRKADEWMNKLIQIPEVRELIEKKVKEITKKG